MSQFQYPAGEPQAVTVRRELDGRTVLVDEAPPLAAFAAKFVDTLPEFFSRHDGQLAFFLSDLTLFYEIVRVEWTPDGDKLIGELIAIR